MSTGPVRVRLAFLVPFAISLAVQSFLLAKVPERYVRPHTRWELQAVAVSLAEHGTFADPYALPTGPTAHLPPIPPAITAVVYRVLGLTLAAGYVAWSLQIVMQALVWGLLPWLAREYGLSPNAGLLAGTVGALVPRWPGHGEALAALALALLGVAFARRWTSGRARPVSSFTLGLGAGVALHVQPAILPVLFGWCAFEAWSWREPAHRARRSALVWVALGLVLACTPWTIRNHRALGAWILVRSNFGLELRMGNHDGAIADLDVMDLEQDLAHPRTDEAEAREIERIGEAAYMREARREATAWIASHPGEFVRLTLARAANWWLGPLRDPPMATFATAITLLALVGAFRVRDAVDLPHRVALVVPLLAYPLVYYVVAYLPRYREPVDWALLLFAASAVLPPRPPSGGA